jgi:hypothetical protein
MILPAEDIQSSIPDAVLVFAEGPKTFVKKRDKTSGELSNSSVEHAANYNIINTGSDSLKLVHTRDRLTMR